MIEYLDQKFVKKDIKREHLFTLNQYENTS